MKQVHPLIQHNSVQKSHSTIHSLPSNLTFWFMLHLLTITCSNAPTHCIFFLHVGLLCSLPSVKQQQVPQQDRELTRLAKVAAFCWQLAVISLHWTAWSNVPCLFSFEANWILVPPKNCCENQLKTDVWDCICIAQHLTEWKKYV